MLQTIGMIGIGLALGSICGYWLLDLERIVNGSSSTGWSEAMTYVYLLLALPCVAVAWVGSWLHKRHEATAIVRLRYLAIVAVLAAVLSAAQVCIEGFPR